MKVFVFTILIPLLMGCATSKEVKVQSDSKIEAKKAKLGNIKVESADYEIKSVRLQGNILHIQITFSGGCVSFSADLIGSEFIMKSMPAKRPVKLILEKEGNCRELKEEEFAFDISELAYKKEKGSEIILLLQGYSEPIKYVFD